MIYWTKEMNEALRDYRAKGFSFSVISNMMGVSRNAIAGRCHRLNLCNKGGPPTVTKKTKPPPVVEVKVNLKTEPKPTITPISTSRGAVASVLASDWKSCRFPIGDPRNEDFQFCGRPTEVGKPYCEAHCKISYVKSIYS